MNRSGGRDETGLYRNIVYVLSRLFYFLEENKEVTLQQEN